jgi:hypothetical protein
VPEAPRRRAPLLSRSARRRTISIIQSSKLVGQARSVAVGRRARAREAAGREAAGRGVVVRGVVAPGVVVRVGRAAGFWTGAGVALVACVTSDAGARRGRGKGGTGVRRCGTGAGAINDVDFAGRGSGGMIAG